MIKLEISTHSGDKDTVEVESYDAATVVEDLNNYEVQAVSFGENIYSRIDIRNIKVILEEE